MRLPVGAGKYATSPAHWERWLARLQGSFADRFQTTAFDRKILLYLVCLYRAFSIGNGVAANAEFYDAFTVGLLDIARGAAGRCIKRELALYVIDMSVLVPDVSLLVLSIRCPSTYAAHHFQPLLDEDAVISDDDAEPAAPPSPLINAPEEPANGGAYDSGYESCDSLPSLLTVVDSSDEGEYDSDSEEDPEEDPEEDALIAKGFVVDEDVSDLDA